MKLVNILIINIFLIHLSLCGFQNYIKESENLLKNAKTIYDFKKKIEKSVPDSIKTWGTKIFNKYQS